VRGVPASLVVVLALLVAPTAFGATGRPVFSDPLTGAPGQHATAVEPDSASWGQTVVSVFQVGRIEDGGAAAIGWATSADGGATWRSGLLPGLTRATSPPGPYGAVSDPVVAYDRVHGVWLASVLTVNALPDGSRDSSLLVSRSADGFTWDLPVVTSPRRGVFVHDKNWIACDNWPASPYAGRCYVTWTDVVTDSIALSVSTDGGTTWSPQRTATDTGDPSGTQPVSRPDGTLVIPYLAFGTSLRVVASPDGGATLGVPAEITDVRTARVPELRAPPLPSADVDGGGRVFVAWHDCRFRRGCSTNDIVVASSADGLTWSGPARVPLSPVRYEGAVERTLRHHVIPGLAADPSTSGSATRLGLASYAVAAVCGASEVSCPITATFIGSRDGGQTWSSPVALSDPHPLAAIAATTQGRMVGDYISTSFVGAGVAVPVVSAPVAAPAGRFDQPILAAALATPAAAPVRAVRLVRGTTTTRPGARLSVRLELDRRPVAGVAVCTATVRGRTIRPVQRALAGERVVCAWRVPRRSAGRTVRLVVGVRHQGGQVRRSASVPIRRAT
jgi:hypothetical protein